MTAPSVTMVNLLGDLWQGGDPDWSGVLDDADAKLHLYGKSEARRGRKMGHLTVRSDVASAAVARALELRSAAAR
jgi:5-(carboxyamino)imidazole ribonucleotide synthase